MMDHEVLFHLDNLRECDVEYIVDVLGITSEQLIESFLPEALAFIKEDMG